jgi:cytochrome c oxidase assembly protein Cox11
MVVIGREPYVVRARIFIALMTAVVACVVILWATFVNTEILGLATAMVPLLTMLCTGLLTTEYLERRSQAKKELEQE